MKTDTTQITGDGWTWSKPTQPRTTQPTPQPQPATWHGPKQSRLVIPSPRMAWETPRGRIIIIKAARWS